MVGSNWLASIVERRLVLGPEYEEAVLRRTFCFASDFTFFTYNFSLPNLLFLCNEGALVEIRQSSSSGLHSRVFTLKLQNFNEFSSVREVCGVLYASGWNLLDINFSTRPKKKDKRNSYHLDHHLPHATLHSLV